MLNNKEISAIIVCRKGSVRVPTKNLLPLGNETILSRKIRQLKSCKHIDRVIVGSDDDKMLKLARSHGAEAIRRPDFYCDEKVASANDMIANMMELMKTDIVVWAHCTNPLISSSTYDLAVETYCKNLDKYDSLLSVVELKEHLWKDGQPLNYNPYTKRHIPARELPPLYMQDGGIFIQSYKQMSTNHYFFGNKPYLFKISNEEFLDVNDMRDYLLAKTLIEHNQKNI